MRILHFGVWKPKVSRVLDGILPSGDVFVDVGANVGYDTLLGSQRVGPNGKVVAIEAMPTTFDLLQRNLALNESARNVRAVPLAVSDKARTLELFYVEDHNMGAVSTLPYRGKRRIGTTTAAPLADILRADEIARVRLIKINVEGGEAAVLRHILGNLDRFPATTYILVEVSPKDDEASWLEIYNRLESQGYKSYDIPNVYGLDWCLSRRNLAPLTLMDALPSEQRDLLFTRGALRASLLQ